MFENKLEVSFEIVGSSRSSSDNSLNVIIIKMTPSVLYTLRWRGLHSIWTRITQRGWPLVSPGSSSVPTFQR